MKFYWGKYNERICLPFSIRLISVIVTLVLKRQIFLHKSVLCRGQMTKIRLLLVIRYSHSYDIYANWTCSVFWISLQLKERTYGAFESFQRLIYTSTSILSFDAAVICNFWHPGTLTLSPERQSARMSKITNDGLIRSSTGCFIAVPIWQQWASKGYTFVQCICFIQL